MSRDYWDQPWFRLLPWRFQQKVMASRYRKVMRMPPSPGSRERALAAGAVRKLRENR